MRKTLEWLCPLVAAGGLIISLFFIEPPSGL
jgi:hypothetical protein